MLTNKMYSIACECACSRSVIENHGNGKQKLACVIVSKDRSCILRKWDKPLQYR